MGYGYITKKKKKWRKEDKKLVMILARKWCAGLIWPPAHSKRDGKSWFSIFLDKRWLLWDAFLLYLDILLLKGTWILAFGFCFLVSQSYYYCSTGVNMTNLRVWKISANSYFVGFRYKWEIEFDKQLWCSCFWLETLHKFIWWLL